jgi:DNA helicase INO80
MELSLQPPLLYFSRAKSLPELHSISTSAWADSCLSRPELKWFVPPVVAPAISVYCTDRTFLESQTQLLDAPTESLAMYGLPPRLQNSEEACARYHACTHGLPPRGLISNSPPDQLPMSNMHVPEAKRLIYDSAKLARLDALLQELKLDDHRVLVYFQMTRMMDLMEEYLIYRQYKYLRLDGSSKLEDRRDMVIDWQTRSVVH